MNKKFYIYQIKNDADYLFCAFEYAVNSGGIQKEDYEKVYEGDMAGGWALEDLFYIFNADIPEDFKGRSMSISDIVIIEDNGKKKAYYVDLIGFKEVDFMEDSDEWFCYFGNIMSKDANEEP